MLLSNFLSLAGAELAGKLITFAAYAYLARVLGPDGFGYIEFAGAVLLCAGLIVDQGFGPYGAREIAKTPDRTTALVAEIVGARLLLAVVAYAGVVLLAVRLDRPPIVTRLMLTYGVSLLAMPFLLQWVFQGHDRMRVVAAAQLLRQVVFVALVLACLRQAADIWLVAVAEVAGACSAAAYCVWRYRRDFGGALRPRLTGSARLWRDGVPIGVSQMLWAARMFGATLILGLIAAPGEVGFFAGALRILVAVHTFVWLYYFNLLPSLARAWDESRASFALVMRRSLRAVAWVGVAAGIVWVGVAPAAMVSVYGAGFAPAGATLQWLAGVGVVAGLSGHYRFGLIAAGRQGVEMATALIGTVAAVSLMPIGYGAAGPRGAAMALVVAEVAVWWSAWACARYMLGLRAHLGLLLRPLLAAGPAVALLLCGWFSPGVRTVAALVAVAALAVLLDGTVRDHLRHLASLCRQLFQRLGKGLPAATRW